VIDLETLRQQVLALATEAHKSQRSKEGKRKYPMETVARWYKGNSSN
jgi:hypothetical protein